MCKQGPLLAVMVCGEGDFICVSVSGCIVCVGVAVEELNLEEVTQQWQCGQMSNYDYIMALNL